MVRIRCPLDRSYVAYLALAESRMARTPLDLDCQTARLADEKEQPPPMRFVRTDGYVR